MPTLTMTILDLKNQFAPGTSQPERKKGHLQCTAQFLNSGNWNAGTQSYVWGFDLIAGQFMKGSFEG